MAVFKKYSTFYDLLYRDKDYAGEAEYVARTIRNFMPHARSILELGSGTGRHGRLLAERGFDVYGIERSPEMVSLASTITPSETAENNGSFACGVGDICTANLDRTFDVVIALFHVISYQTNNQSLEAAFRVASNHLNPGGFFLFDVWHGPAVLLQGPSERVKEVADDRYRVNRLARPELDTNLSTVKVVYQIECEDRVSGEAVKFSEEHLMRYFFPTEIELLADTCGFTRLLFEEFLTGLPASPATWGVTYILRRQP